MYEKLIGLFATIFVVAVYLYVIMKNDKHRRDYCRTHGHCWDYATVWNPRNRDYQTGWVCRHCGTESY